MSLLRCGLRPYGRLASAAKQLNGQRWSHYDLGPGVKKMTIPRIYEMYQQGVPISCLTAHDAISARIADKAGVDMVLVGDSLAMVAMGLENTNGIDLDEMVYHTKAVCRGAKRPFIISDLPFGSYEVSTEQACASAIKMMKGGAEAVKFEGGRELVPIVKHLSSFGIPTVPHIGLTPQRQVASGGFKVQGKSAESAYELYQDALALQNAGATMLLVEGVPDRVASVLTSRLQVPTIGIGAGPGTSAQVLVQLDMLGGFDTFVPKFLKKYTNYLDENVAAIREYHNDVKEKRFPELTTHTYTMRDTEYEKFAQLVDQAS